MADRWQVVSGAFGRENAISRLTMTGAFMADGIEDHALPLTRVMPDPHGQAALLLVESILHALIEKGALTLAEALSAVASAREVAGEAAKVADTTGGEGGPAFDLIGAIHDSMETEL